MGIVRKWVPKPKSVVASPDPTIDADGFRTVPAKKSTPIVSSEASGPLNTSNGFEILKTVLESHTNQVTALMMCPTNLDSLGIILDSISTSPVDRTALGALSHPPNA